MVCFRPWEDNKQTNINENENEVNNLDLFDCDIMYSDMVQENLENCSSTKDYNNCVDMEIDTQFAIINGNNVEDSDNLFHFKETSKYY